MRRDRFPITFNKLAVVWFSALTVVTIAAVCAWFVATVRASGGSMAGNWVGTCQDGRPFVLVDLKQSLGGYGGMISLGNVKITSQPGETEGSCHVNDPPSPQHAMKITKSVATEKMLTFDSDHGQEYEMKLTGSDTATLRFVGTNRDESWFALRRVR
jgi:hypothetical protein